MTETPDTEVTTERNSRSAETRETQTRRKPWQPPSMLDAPNAPAGYKFRWIRESTRGIILSFKLQLLRTEYMQEL